MTSLDSIFKSRDITLPTSSQGYGFSSSHVWMWELDCEKSWALKNWCFWTVVLENLKSPLDCNKIQPVHPKGDQSWVFTGITYLSSSDLLSLMSSRELKLQYFGHLMRRADSFDHREKSLEGYSPWGHRESDTTDWLTHNTQQYLQNSKSLWVDSAYRNKQSLQGTNKAFLFFQPPFS